MLQSVLMDDMAPGHTLPFDHLRQAPIILTEAQVNQALASRTEHYDPNILWSSISTEGHP